MCISVFTINLTSRHSPFTPHKLIETKFVLRSLCQCIKSQETPGIFFFLGGNAVEVFQQDHQFSPFVHDFLVRSSFQSSYVRSLTLALMIVTYNVAIAAIISDLFVASSSRAFQQYRTFQIFPHTSKMSANIRQQCNGNLILPQIRLSTPMNPFI